MKRLLFAIVFFAGVSTGCSLFSRRSDDKPAEIARESVDNAEQAHDQAKDQVDAYMEQAKDMAHAAGEHASGWSYDGLTGPDHWGELKPDYALCKDGKKQSPVDLKWSKPRKGGTIKLNYKSADGKVVDNGHTVQVNVAPGNKAMIRGQEYELAQFHFHSSSEHTLSGNVMPMEVHFVHKNKKGGLAVIGAFLIAGDSNPEIDKIWNHVPQAKNEEASAGEINLKALLPKKQTYYQYTGSLTTPPCTEGVNWNVMNTPITLSKEQILAFRALYSINNRPVQPLNGRKVSNY